MKLVSKSTTFSEIIMFFALSGGLWFFYSLSLDLGFSKSDSQGISSVLLLIAIALYLVISRIWVRWRIDQRYKGLSIEQRIYEMDKWIEDGIDEGIITREELEQIKALAKVKFELDKLNIKK